MYTAGATTDRRLLTSSYFGIDSPQLGQRSNKSFAFLYSFTGLLLSVDICPSPLKFVFEKSFLGSMNFIIDMLWYPITPYGAILCLKIILLWHTYTYNHNVKTASFLRFQFPSLKV
uniref:Uncharacterized protein n=1 Tax=Glossina brevipalpis TaxID=37001 RepID=A0A1A9WNE9_9MUSC